MIMNTTHKEIKNQKLVDLIWRIHFDPQHIQGNVKSILGKHYVIQIHTNNGYIR